MIDIEPVASCTLSTAELCGSLDRNLPSILPNSHVDRTVLHHSSKTAHKCYLLLNCCNAATRSLATGARNPPRMAVTITVIVFPPGVSWRNRKTLSPAIRVLSPKDAHCR